MKYFFLVLFFSLYCLESKEIALTFDDVPWGTTQLFTMEKRIEILLEKLDAAHVKGAFFCVGSQIERERGKRALELIEKSGHFLANHSYNHLHLSTLTIEEFALEMERTEKLLKHYSGYRRWFRFPYLDYGGNAQKQKEAFSLLEEKGYSNAYLTIKTCDWHLNHCLVKAIEENRRVDFQKFKALYLFFLERWIDGFERNFNPHVKHVLLLHGNDINALYLDSLIALLHKKGWTLISPEVAYAQEKTVAKPITFQAPPSLSCDYIDAVVGRSEALSLR